MSSRPVALVTGASAGIGRELATVLAREGHDLVLVARRQAELDELAATLKEKYGATAQVIAADLAEPDAAAKVLAELGPEPQVDVLVNNAGFGGHGAFADRDRDADLRMVAVNVTALTDLTKLVLPSMVARGRGRILNVASTVDWPRLGAGDGTLVVLMAVANLRPIAAALLEAGRPADTPAAVVENASLPSQRVVYSTLAALADDAERARIEPPAVVVIGPVAAAPLDTAIMREPGF